MTITELKKLNNERIINLVVTDIVTTGLKKLVPDALAITMQDEPTPLAKDWAECFTRINSSAWDDIRSIIKRSL